MTTFFKIVTNKFLVCILLVLALTPVVSNTIAAQSLNTGEGTNQPFEFEVKEYSGYKGAETLHTKPVKYIEFDKGKASIVGNIFLINMDNATGLGLIFDNLSINDNRTSTIEKMQEEGQLTMTLSNNEVLEGKYLDIIETLFGVGITTIANQFKSSNKSFQGLSQKDIDKYVCNQLSTYDMTKIQIGSVEFNVMSDAEAKKKEKTPFRTAATIKAMLDSIK